MRKQNLLMSAVIGVALLGLMPSAQADNPGVNVGTLQCEVEGGWGHVIASSRDMNCIFRPVDGGAEHYKGQLRRYGVDLGYTSDARLVWGVVAATSDMTRGALEGEYAGASAQATVGVGLGANVLVGGLDRSIALQPLSPEGNTGAAVAAGVGVIVLREG